MMKMKIFLNHFTFHTFSFFSQSEIWKDYVNFPHFWVWKSVPSSNEWMNFPKFSFSILNKIRDLVEGAWKSLRSSPYWMSEEVENSENFSFFFCLHQHRRLLIHLFMRLKHVVEVGVVCRRVEWSLNFSHSIGKF